MCNKTKSRYVIKSDDHTNLDFYLNSNIGYIKNILEFRNTKLHYVHNIIICITQVTCNYQVI